MDVLSIVILAGIGIWLAFSLKSFVKQKKSGCSGDCSCCGKHGCKR